MGLVHNDAGFSTCLGHHGDNNAQPDNNGEQQDKIGFSFSDSHNKTVLPNYTLNQNN